MRLTIEQVIQYQTEGYLIVEDVLSDEILQPVIDEIKAEIDKKAQQLHAEGKIANLYEAEPFDKRYALLHAQCAEIGRGLDINEYLGEAMFDFLKNDSLLDLVECLLGSELSCNPIQHVRAKLPVNPAAGRSETSYYENVPWHQDCAVTSEDSEASEIITFWLPLIDATAETGCMEVMPEVFKRGYMKHQAEGGTTIVPEQLPHVEPVCAECRKGGVVIMNKYTPHRGITNRSDRVRWSIDLRYHKSGANSGRSFQPSFAVRSKAAPENILTDHETWRSLWEASRNQPPAHKIHRV
ncbi:phytanoyl-CoA dioxygenase family protein [Paenibacillus mendelii]|uniref:Phytanoyl-CoA dioxygenase family protein n=1 Tax=Paenibacillus mendelii TaxID=206163 RepID=A0ABV6JN96_9BACL|nr:phytanoyl-CoA dioxygenase family protein [Paenibacillus mendelii]MCQ6558958.1 phytanoyl-CoA dioxygenase family protein [Paenibacillus mendelii]